MVSRHIESPGRIMQNRTAYVSFLRLRLNEKPRVTSRQHTQEAESTVESQLRLTGLYRKLRRTLSNV